LERRNLELEKKYTFSMEMYEPMMKRVTNVEISVGLLRSRYETYPPQQFDLTVGEEDAEGCHDFRHFPTFSCLSPKRPHSFTQPMTCFPFPFPHDLYLIFYPTFYLIFLFSHFGYQGQVKFIRFTR